MGLVRQEDPALLDPPTGISPLPPHPTPSAGVRRQSRLQVAVFIGGVIGALSRAGVSRALPWPAHGWPWATFVVNVTGTLLLGYFVTRLQERLPPSTYRRPLLGTGVCGALTTFSTFQIELIRLVRADQSLVAGTYLCASLAAGLVGMHVASVLTRRVRR
jgi:fluoride exporter